MSSGGVDTTEITSAEIVRNENVSKASVPINGKPSHCAVTVSAGAGAYEIG